MEYSGTGKHTLMEHILAGGVIFHERNCMRYRLPREKKEKGFYLVAVVGTGVWTVGAPRTDSPFLTMIIPVALV